MIKIMRRILSVGLLLSFLISPGQSNEKEQVMKVVNNVFLAMKTSDSVLLKTSFTESPATYTVFNTPTGETRFVEGKFQKFIDAVGQPKKEVWSEPIWNEKVEIDGPLAQVWVDYAFYLDKQFLHCGVDAFHLVKMNGQWKIFHLVDTRRKASCEVPEDVRKRFEE